MSDDKALEGLALSPLDCVAYDHANAPENIAESAR